MSKSINQGENNGSAKLTLEAVKVIRHLLACGHTGKDICTVYGLSAGLVSGIKTGTLWAGTDEQLQDKWRDG